MNCCHCVYELSIITYQLSTLFCHWHTKIDLCRMASRLAGLHTTCCCESWLPIPSGFITSMSADDLNRRQQPAQALFGNSKTPEFSCKRRLL